MLKVIKYFVGNLIMAWVLVQLLSSSLHYPPDIPLRFQVMPAALVTSVAFSILSLPVTFLGWTWRFLALVMVSLLSIATAGFCMFSLDRYDGALIALHIACFSPLVSLSGIIWGWLWNLVTFPPLKALPPLVSLLREELPVSDVWSGSEH